jgi:hypothetical protein
MQVSGQLALRRHRPSRKSKLIRSKFSLLLRSRDDNESPDFAADTVEPNLASCAVVSQVCLFAVGVVVRLGAKAHRILAHGVPCQLNSSMRNP